MENAAIRPHKSHMASAGRLPARSLPVGGRRNCTPVSADGAYDIVTAVRHGIPAACMVIASARREAGAWRVWHVTAGMTAGPALAVSRQARPAARRAADTARGRTAVAAIRRT